MPAILQDERPILLFDVDGVVIHGYHARPELRVCWDENIEADFGLSRDIFKQEFIQKDFIEKVLRGKMDLLVALEKFLSSQAVTCTSQEFLNYWLEKDSKLNQTLLDIIARLKGTNKYRLFLATNQEHYRARHLMNNLGLKNYFEDIFYAARIGYIKPETEFYSWIEDHLCHPPAHQIILFDDTPEVVVAARLRGWQAIEYSQDMIANIFDLYS